MDTMLENLNEFAEQKQEVYDRAYQACTDAVNSMTAVLVPDEQQVGELFEALLTFRDDKRFMELYKKLCRHIFAIYPNLADNYIQLYHSKYKTTEYEQRQKNKPPKKLGRNRSYFS